MSINIATLPEKSRVGGVGEGLNRQGHGMFACCLVVYGNNSCPVRWPGVWGLLQILRA